MGRERRGSTNSSKSATVKVTGHWPRQGGGETAHLSTQRCGMAVPGGSFDLFPYLRSTETCARHTAKLWACRAKETGSC